MLLDEKADTPEAAQLIADFARAVEPRGRSRNARRYPRVGLAWLVETCGPTYIPLYEAVEG
jgi:hypothetical protein